MDNKLKTAIKCALQNVLVPDGDTRLATSEGQRRQATMAAIDAAALAVAHAVHDDFKDAKAKAIAAARMAKAVAVESRRPTRTRPVHPNPVIEHIWRRFEHGSWLDVIGQEIGLTDEQVFELVKSATAPGVFEAGATDGGTIDLPKDIGLPQDGGA